MQPSLFGNLLSQSRSGTSSFFQFEALGSTVGLTNDLGAVTDTYLYKAFGDLLASSGATVNPWRFVGAAGYAFDADLAHYYLRARHLDAATGRFLSLDPLLQHALTSLVTGADIQSAFSALLRGNGLGHAGDVTNLIFAIVQSPYAYADGDPVNSIDPSGLLTRLIGGGLASGSENLAGLAGEFSAGVVTIGGVATVFSSPKCALALAQLLQFVVGICACTFLGIALIIAVLAFILDGTKTFSLLALLAAIGLWAICLGGIALAVTPGLGALANNVTVNCPQGLAIASF